MNTILIILIGILLVLTGFLLFQVLMLRKNDDDAVNQKETANKIKEMSADFSQGLRENREEMSKNIQVVNETIHAQINAQGMGQAKQLDMLSKNNEESMERLRITMDTKLNAIQENNEKKLDEMRKTVDEKLESTLNKRLGESFNLVNERLEQVHKSLGEMQTLSTNLTDIKKIFTNVKSRGVWGEVQLGNVLEEILAPNQFVANYAPKPKSDERVEFAVCLPARDQDQGSVYLPIDSKFPVEDYQRLVEAEELADAAAVEACRKALESALKKAAKTIHDKYIQPPATLEYAVMFLPTESLYAEALRLTGFMEYAQEQCQVMVAGPTNLAALLNSIKLGFRSLAIQEKSGEIRELLGAVKTQMGRFAVSLEKVQKKISEADKSLGEATHRTQIITKKLNRIEGISEGETQVLLEDEE